MRCNTALFATIILIVTMLTACAKPSGKLTTVELLELGEKYLLEMNYEQAVVNFLKVIEVEPMNPRGYTGLAEAYIGLGENSKAVELLREGLKLLPDNAEIQGMVYNLVAAEPENTLDTDANTDPILTPSEFAEQRPSELFVDILQVDEITLAGVPFWQCTVDVLRNTYPEGRSLEGADLPPGFDFFFIGPNHDNEQGLDFQFYSQGDGSRAEIYKGAEFRNLVTGISLEDAVIALGFSPEGATLIREKAALRQSLLITVENGVCKKVEYTDAEPAEVFFINFCYNRTPNNIEYFSVRFTGGVLDYISIDAY